MLKRQINRFLMSVGMFSRLPAPHANFENGTTGILGFFPLVGLIIGLLWYGVSVLARAVLPPLVGGAVLCLLPYLLTGFLHLDGFMDVTDAVMSRRPLEQRQKILKDPHCGAFAVCGAAGILLIWFSVLSSPLNDLRPLILIPVASRSISGLATLCLPAIGQSTLAKSFRADRLPSDIPLMVLLLLSSWAGLVWMMGMAGIVLAVSFCAVELICGMSAKKQLGGFSGDVAGYMLVCGETAALLALTVLEGIVWF